MRILRYFLLVASLSMSAFMLYAITKSPNANRFELLMVFGLAVGGVVNFAYIFLCPPNSK